MRELEDARSELENRKLIEAKRKAANASRTQKALSAAAVASLPPQRFAVGSAVNQTARQVGGALISDSYTRVVWILFLLLSIPTGFHHQYTDPGISNVMKAIHGVLTFGVFFPSLATAFSVMAALEIGGRRAGGTGLLGWIRKLPWGDPSVTAQLLAFIRDQARRCL